MKRPVHIIWLRRQRYPVRLLWVLLVFPLYFVLVILVALYIFAQELWRGARAGVRDGWDFAKYELRAFLREWLGRNSRDVD